MQISNNWITPRRLSQLAGLVLSLIVGARSLVQAQVNLLGWTFRVGGQTIHLGSDGSIQIPNISAPDQFGEGGPGTRPDFKSDDFLRVVGKSNDEGVPLYAFSEFFRVEQGKKYTIQSWTFTSLPPPVPQFLRAKADKPALTKIGETAQITVTGLMGDDSTQDLTHKENWTTYRSSSADVVGVDADGMITARGAGVAFVTAVNESTAAVVQIDVIPGGQLTSIQGVALDGNGAPVPGVTAFVIGAGGQADTQADGKFIIAGVAAQKRISGIIVRGKTSKGDVFGKSGPLATTADGLTDAGLITVKTCAELGIDCVDTDNDCIPDSVETKHGLNPRSPDTNNNGIPDGEEDSDGDGIPNCMEILIGTDPFNKDTDGDGLSDWDEIHRYFTDPADRDTDKDGLSDGEEIARGTDPFNPDTDGDGFDDATEILEGMNPLVADPPLIRSVASRPVTYLAAGRRESLPIEVAVTVVSRPATYGNLQTVPIPESVPVSIASDTVSYFNALAVPGPLKGFAVSSVVSYRRNLPVSASVEPEVKAGREGEPAGGPVRSVVSPLSTSVNK